MSIVIGLDIGTSKLSALAWDTKAKRVLAAAGVANDADISGLAPGWFEQNPGRIAEALLQALKQVLANPSVKAGEVAGVGVTGQMHGVMLIDPKSGKPLTNLIIWRDQRGLEILPGLAEKLAGKATTGCGLHPGYGGLNLAWLSAKGKLPANAKALTIADYVVYRLTGVIATEPTHAASWGIYDLQQEAWASKMLEALNIPAAILPEVRPSAKPAGNLLAGLAGEMKLPKEVAVCAPVGDNQASFIGAAGGVGLGTAVLNLGSGGQISVPCAGLRLAEGLETRPLPLGGYILVGASLCGGLAYAHLRQFFQAVAKEIAGVEISEGEAYAKMNALAAAASTGSLAADTRYMGTRGNPSLRGSFTGIDQQNLTPANLSRAVLVGMVRELYDMAKQNSIDLPGRIVASGNGVRKNPLLPKIIHEVFGAPCEISPNLEEAASGAAMAAAEGLGLK